MHQSTVRAPPASSARFNWRRNVVVATQRAEEFRRDRGAVALEQLRSAAEVRLAAGAPDQWFRAGRGRSARGRPGLVVRTARCPPAVDPYAPTELGAPFGFAFTTDAFQFDRNEPIDPCLVNDPKAASERIQSGLSPKTITSSAAVWRRPRSAQGVRCAHAPPKAPSTVGPFQSQPAKTVRSEITLHLQKKGNRQSRLPHKMSGGR